MYIQYIAWWLNLRPLLTWWSWCQYWNLYSKTLVSTGCIKSTSSNLAVLAYHSLDEKRRRFWDKLPFSWHTSTRGGSGRGPGGRKSIEFYRFLHDSWWMGWSVKCWVGRWPPVGLSKMDTNPDVIHENHESFLDTFFLCINIHIHTVYCCIYSTCMYILK